MANLTGPVWMTPAALASLEAELAQLTEHPSETTAARVIELREIIRNAEVGTKPDDGLVEPGMIVTVRFEADASTVRFLLGSRELFGDDTEVDVYSPTSPLGAAITGRYVGDIVQFVAPSGTTRDVSILEAVPFG